MLTKKCKICRKPNRPFRTTCSIECEAELGLRLLEKAKRAEAKQVRAVDKVRKEKLKSRSDWMREAQIAFNRYCRLRDYDLGCISCDKDRYWHGQWHASHFRSVGSSPATRFNLWNVNKSCSICNNYLSGNLSEYEPRLREKIGNLKVDLLRSLNHNPKYSIEYLRRIRDVFRKKSARLERRMERYSGV